MASRNSGEGNEGSGEHGIEVLHETIDEGRDDDKENEPGLKKKNKGNEETHVKSSRNEEMKDSRGSYFCNGNLSILLWHGQHYHARQ